MELLRYLAKKYKLAALYYAFLMDMRKQNISAYAAGAAFFLFLSLVPMLMLVCSVLPYTPLSEELLVRYVTDVLPDMFDAVAVRWITQVYDANAGVLTFSAIATVWTASKGVMGLMMGLNAVNEVEEKRNWIVIRLVSSLYMLVMLLVLFVSLLLLVFGKRIMLFFVLQWPKLSVLYDFLVRPRFFYLFLILTIFFAVLFTAFPSKKLKVREQLPGAMISAAGWIAYSFIFSLYVTYSETITIYGSISMIVIAMLWTYFCMYLLLVGAYINRFFHPVNLVLVYPRRRS